MSQLPIPPERAAYLTRRCGRVGGAVIAFALVVAVVSAGAALLVGGALGAIAISIGITGAGLAVLSGLILRNAPAHVRDLYLDEPRARTVRRVLLLLCLASGLCYLGLVVAAVALEPGAVTIALLVLEAFPFMLTVAAFVTGNRVLRP